jgi:hypothetical protein
MSNEPLTRGVWPNVEAYGTNKMYYHHTFLPHSKQRTRVLAAMAAAGGEEVGIASAAAAGGRDIYTFGVYTGSSCKFWHERMPLVGMAYARQWGFDSFEGLPEEAEGCALECKAWLPGAFSAADQFGVDTWSQCQAKLYSHVLGEDKARDASERSKFQMIKGFFSESLTPTLASERGMQPALLIDMDVDLYISTSQALTWAFEQGIVVPGTFVYYDDVSIVKADGGGELRAHEEVSARFGVQWRKYSDDLWRVVSIDGPRRASSAERLGRLVEAMGQSARAAQSRPAVVAAIACAVAAAVYAISSRKR